MSWNGSGIYTLPPLYSPEVNGTVIDAARYNGLTSDVAAGINNCLTKDGQNVPTANLPMGGFKHTGLSEPSAAGQALLYNQAGIASLLGNLRVGHPSLTGLRSIMTFSSADVAPASYRTGTVAGFLRSNAAASAGGIAVISGNAATAFLTLGDTDAASQGGVEYSNSTDTLWLRANGSNRVSVTDAIVTGAGLTAKFAQFETTTADVSITDLGVVVSGGATFGYAASSGVNVTQGAGARTVTVVSNNLSGLITTNSGSVAAGATAIIPVQNNLATDDTMVLLNLFNDSAFWRIAPAVKTFNGFDIQLTNITGSASTAPVAIGFMLIQGGLA